MENIYSVCEAFSMQPLSWTVGYIYSTGQTLLRIEKGTIFDTGDPYDAYIGYDSTGKKVFQIRVLAATVQFK